MRVSERRLLPKKISGRGRCNAAEALTGGERVQGGGAYVSDSGALEMGCLAAVTVQPCRVTLRGRVAMRNSRVELGLIVHHGEFSRSSYAVPCRGPR